jgi:hypothetical protein
MTKADFLKKGVGLLVLAGRGESNSGALSVGQSSVAPIKR